MLNLSLQDIRELINLKETNLGEYKKLLDDIKGIGEDLNAKGIEHGLF
jgi:hypothetical protein